MNGRIKSLPRNGTTKSERILKQRLGNRGYMQICLHIENKKKLLSVHRLVAQAFIDNPNNLPQVNHIDGNKQNNKVENLEWCTAKENGIHAYKTGLIKAKLGEQHSNCKKIIQYDLQGNSIKEWKYIDEAQKQLKINNICKCCQGKQKTAGGYIWRYKDT